MKKHLMPGDMLPDGDVVLLDGSRTRLGRLLEGREAMLYFMRDSACVLCLHELAKLQAALGSFCQRNILPIACVSSTPEAARANLGNRCSFPVICDAAGGLYSAFGAEPAHDKEAMEGPHTLERIEAAKNAGMVHGEDSGNPLQLPAVFGVDGKGRLRFSYYAATAEDIPEPESLLSRFGNEWSSIF